MDQSDRPGRLPKFFHTFLFFGIFGNLASKDCYRGPINRWSSFGLKGPPVERKHTFFSGYFMLLYELKNCTPLSLFQKVRVLFRKTKCFSALWSTTRASHLAKAMSFHAGFVDINSFLSQSLRVCIWKDDGCRVKFPKKHDVAILGIFRAIHIILISGQ